jgi:Ca2+-transporting ATPase
MEVALHAAYLKIAEADERPDFHLVHEYPLSGKPPMMTHIFENEKGKRIVAAKGAPEALRKVCHLTAEEGERIDQTINLLAKDGYRVLSVGEASFEGNNFPESQESFKFTFKGIVAFYDPPKQNIQSVLEKFDAAGIAVKIITGDNAATTTAIAKQIGFRGYDKSVSGEDLMKMDADTLKKAVMDFQIFTRMFPDAKLKIIEALKSNQQIVAMTGDGVNDGPALKSAHIGIAMGKKGSEIAKQAASLILVDDDLSKMVDAIASGRKIYTNLKKAIQYIISIHIPIILIVFIPLVLNWIYPNILSPLHIIFLELIMGPTCSMVFENEPIEKNTMLEKPRPFTNVFFSWKELSTSLIQGCVITLGTLITYQYAVLSGFDESTTRAMVFTDLIFANLFLTLVNRSFLYSIFTTSRYKNNLVLIVTGITLVILMLLLYLPVFAKFFEFKQLGFFQFLFAAGIGFLSVVWYELVKLQKRMSSKKI